MVAPPDRNRFRRDALRAFALLFGPMLAGAIIVPLVLLVFAVVGRPN